MKRWMVVAIISTVLAYTNPPQDKYLDWATTQFSSRAQTTVCQKLSLVSLLRYPGLSEFCRLSVDLLRSSGITRSLLRTHTTRHHLLFLSLYQTELSGHKTQTIGILNQFIVISSRSDR